MAPLERLGDRRNELRFEILGDLWATLVTTQSLPVVNLSAGGVLVECAGPLVVDSVQRVRLTLGDQICEVSARVRHVTPTYGRPDTYFVGLQFADLPDDARDRLTALVGAGRAPRPQKEV